MFKRLLFLFQRRSLPNRNPPIIEATADGFVLRANDGTPINVQWASVRRAAGYKRDLYTTDAIMLSLELDPPAPAVLELSKEWLGFTDLFGGMEPCNHGSA